MAKRRIVHGNKRESPVSVAHELDMGGESYELATRPSLHLIVSNSQIVESLEETKHNDKDLEDWYGHLSPQEIGAMALGKRNVARIAQLQMSAAHDVSSYDNEAYSTWLGVYNDTIGPFDGNSA